jgi:CHAT domain-containing protein/tetratricopeptide (TPR) repeat protein
MRFHAIRMIRPWILAPLFAAIAAFAQPAAAPLSVTDAERATVQRLIATSPGTSVADVLAAESPNLTLGVLRELINIGNAAQKTNEEESLRIQEIALAGGKLLNNQLDIGVAHFNIGNILNHLARYDEALEHFRLSIQPIGATGELWRVANALSNQALTLQHLGEPADAVQVSQRAYDLAVQAGDSVSQARILNTLGTSYSRAGDYRRALDHFERSLKLADAAHERLGMAYNFDDIASVYRLQGNYGVAISYLRKSLDIKEQSGGKHEIAGSLANLGDIYLQEGQAERAMPLLRRAVELARESGRKSAQAETLRELAQALRREGQYGEALRRLRASLELSEGSGEKPQSASTLASIAEIEQLQQNYSAAIADSERALALASETGAARTLIAAGITLGRAYAASDRKAEARAAFENAIAAVEELREHVVGGEQDRQAFLAQCIDPYEEMIVLNLAEHKPEAALEMAERAKSRILLEVLRTGRADVHKEMTPPELAEEMRLTRRLVTLNAQIELAEGSRADDLRRRRDEMRIERTAFETRLYASHPGLREHRAEAPALGLAGFAKLVPDDRTMLLEFVVTPRRTFMFAIVREGGAPSLLVRSVPGDAAALRTKVEKFSSQLAARDPGFPVLSRELYRLLFGPLESALRGKTRIAIVPDGPLWGLPFQALQSGSGRYAAEDHAIFYAPSFSVLSAMMATQRSGEQDAKLLVLANPSGDTPEAEREAAGLGKLYGPSRSAIYTRDLATEDVLMQQARRYAIVHIAAHGTFDDSSPMYSHLVLSKSKTTSGNDGILEAWELMNLNLRARLVVLSGCDTARGRFGAGEGLIGMTWALFVGGASATLAGQWKVESSSTSDLMLEFYRGLNNGLGKAEALQRAQLSLLHTEKYAHPFYWAGFVLVGDGS